MNLIRRKSCIRHFSVLPFRLPHFMTDHCRKAMLSYRIGICKIILQLPEEVIVVLDCAFIGCSCPVSKLNHRGILFCLACSDIKSKFGMPSEVLDRSDIRKDISVEFLTTQENIIHHCQSDRVRSLMIFADH